jgi:hypothetical protein
MRGINPIRIPAEVNGTCNEMAKKIFLTENYTEDLMTALEKKKLITFSEKRMQLQYPSLNWINKVKKSFNKSLRNWNNNRYPAFYIFQDEEIIPTAKRYAENLEKILTNQIPIEDDQTSKAYLDVSEWLNSYISYNLEIDQLIEERISLQYNINLLKKLKLKNDDAIDVQLSIMKNGKMKNEIITFRKEDKNLNATINKLKLEVKSLDGTFLKNGKIKERVIRQAMLLDMLSIVHRELEYALKNAAAPNELVLKEFESLSKIISVNTFSPSSYGVYKIDNKVFIREVIATSKLDVAYMKIKAPLIQLKDWFKNFFVKSDEIDDPEKIGIFKKAYLSITQMTPKQAAISGGSILTVGYGFQRYFTINNKTTTELSDQMQSEEIKAEDAAHLQQVEQTKQIEMQKSDSLSSAIEIPIEELIQKRDN